MADTRPIRRVAIDDTYGQEMVEGWTDYLKELVGPAMGLGGGVNLTPSGDLIVYSQVGWVRLRIVAAAETDSNEEVVIVER